MNLCPSEPSLPGASTALTPSQLQGVYTYAAHLDTEIDALLEEERKVLGHMLARLAVDAHPTTKRVTVHDLRIIEVFEAITCEVDENPMGLDIGREGASMLIPMLHRLPPGSSAAWVRHRDTIDLDVNLALTFGEQYPFRPVGERLIAHLEDKTGRSIRRVDIRSDLSDNRYSFADTVDVDYSDGDSDEIYLEAISDFSDDLQHEVGDPGANTLVTIRHSSTGVTIRHTSTGVTSAAT